MPATIISAIEPLIAPTIQMARASNHEAMGFLMKLEAMLEFILFPFVKVVLIPSS